MDLLTISEPIRGTVSAPQSSIAHRDEILTESKKVTQVNNASELEQAVESMRHLAGIAKETEAARKTVKAPVLQLGKTIDTVADTFIAPVKKEQDRICEIVNAYQRAERDRQILRDRDAREATERLEREAREAQRKIEEAKTPELKLCAQLDAEEIGLARQAAAMELTVPTNTPKGLSTRVGYDFQMLNLKVFIAAFPIFAKVADDQESLKLDRAGLKKELNSDDPKFGVHNLLPDEKNGHTEMTGHGIRVFLDVKTQVRS